MAHLLLAVLIFSLSLFAILARPRGISEAVSSSLGGVCMVGSGIVSLGEATHLLLNSWNVLLFFAGLVAVAWTVEQSGFFRWVALWSAVLARGGTLWLLLNVFAIGALISTLLSNDATALLLTPVVLALTQELDLPPVPFALACTFIADTASVSLPVSNPINVLFLDAFPQIRLGDYLGHLLVPSLLAVALNVGLFMLLFRRKTGCRFDPARLPAPVTAIEHPRFFRYALGCLVLMSGAYLAGSIAGWPLSLVALTSAAALVAGGIYLKALPAAQLRTAPWTIVPFIAGLLVLVQGLENAGITTWLGIQLVKVASHGPVAGVLAVTLATAAGSNVINNVPMATVMVAAIRHGQVMPSALQHQLVYGAIFGADIGPNLTILGSLSTVLWLVLLRRRQVEISSWDYIRTGLIVTPPMLVVGALAIALLR